MGILKELAYLIPVRIGRRREPDTSSLSGRLTVNRRDTQSGLLVLGDVLENIRDEWVATTRRIPPESAILRDEDNHYRGNASFTKRIRR